MTEQIDNSTAPATDAGTPENLEAQAAPIMGGDATPAGDAQVTDWKDSIPAELKGDPVFDKFNTLEDALKSLKHGQNMISKRNEDLTPEEIGTLLNNTGRPEEANSYELDIQEGFDSNMVDNFKGIAHGAGLTQEQAAKVYDDYNAMITEAQSIQITEQAREKEANADTIKKQYGSAFDEHAELANRALEELGGKEAVEAITTAGLENNPALFNLLANAGKMLSEGKFVESKKAGGYGMTPGDAAAKIEQLRGDVDFQKRLVSGNKDARSLWDSLYQTKVAGQ